MATFVRPTAKQCSGTSGSLDAELLNLDAELLNASPNVGEIKGHRLELLDQFNRSYQCGGRCLTVGRRLCCRDGQQPGQRRNLRARSEERRVGKGGRVRGGT